MRPDYKNIDELIAYPANPKTHDLGAIHTSIKQFGFLERIVVNETTGHILSGHGRVETLIQKHRAGEELPEGVIAQNGSWFAPVDYVSVPADKEGAAIIALNRTTELGGWDNQTLVTLLQEIAAIDDNLLWSTGYDGDDIDRMLFELSPDFKEYDETIANDVEYNECPECGHKWSK